MIRRTALWFLPLTVASACSLVPPAPQPTPAPPTPTPPSPRPTQPTQPTSPSPTTPVPTPAPGGAGWTGTVSLHSSSVPPPYGWEREATVTGTSASMRVGWFPDKAKTTPTDKTWNRQLTADELAKVTALVASLPASAPAVNPGSCWNTVDLKDASGRTVKLSAAPATSAGATIKQIWTLLAGPEDPVLPEHSYSCG